MAWDSVKYLKDKAEELLGDTFAGHLANVATEHGITLASLSAIYTSPRPEPTYVYPHAEIAGLSGEAGSNGQSGAVDATGWIIIADQNADPDVLEARMIGYLTALMRTFHRVEGGNYSLSVAGIDELPPLQTTVGPWEGAVGVRVRYKMTESIG